ncbi:epoxide hydrolase [Litchfieldella qijiaojingensis]|uniref:Epoxide hydrolase n=1 Tax=Litchfieldella qijiaojingensis TaxID=980347 RepID=A0ABQ2Z539_9GAMM|nr:alpha/beta hydrolase [Halomonas qijiaojingensis]GGY01652.1 epoxide hydrolase [Halomonas qijiaojingensis]
MPISNSAALLSPRLQEWLSAGAEYNYQGHRLYYRVQGSGPALLLLHGYPTASWGWHKIWTDLIRQWTVVTIDLLGSGFSDKPPTGPYDVASLADQCEGVLRYLGMTEVDVLAHAYGVTTAQELLARHLEHGDRRELHLRSASFINGGLFPEGMHPTPMQRLLIGPLGPTIVALAPQPYTIFRRKLGRNFGPAHQPTETEMEELWQLLRYKEGHQVTPRVLQYLRERWQRRERWVGALQHAELPLQLINGSADPVAGADMPGLWRRHVPAGWLHELGPAIGHYPPLEAPRETLAAYCEFRRLGAASVSETLPGSNASSAG